MAAVFLEGTARAVCEFFLKESALSLSLSLSLSADAESMLSVPVRTERNSPAAGMQFGNLSIPVVLP
jgi:hypothetical protein